VGDWAHKYFLSIEEQGRLSFNYSCSERKTFGLLHLEDVVQIQVSTEPDSNNYGKEYKARTVVDYPNTGKQ
jgi:hypothetical protein